MKHTIQHTNSFKRWMMSLSLVIFHFSFSIAQITIGGNIYGGGNKGATGGNTTVTVYQGDLDKVFGGARMANVGGRTFVNIDGEHANDYILINYVYGGNDISGTIGSGTSLPTELTEVETHEGTGNKTANDKNDIDNTWNAFVRVSSMPITPAVHYTQEEIDAAAEGDDAYGKTTNDIKTPENDPNKQIYIGQLFGGGNGDYERTVTTDDENVTTYTLKDKKTQEVIATSNTDFIPPRLSKTYLELLGGSIVYAYGGGNNATVTEKTVICLDNPSKVVSSIMVNGEDLITKDNRVEEKMGINMVYSFPSSDQYQIGNFYGGNNTAEMAIRPLWNLKKGKIRNLYSGGNRGAMTSPEGLLLELNPANDADLVVENVYGGCRMADVIPTGTVDGVSSYVPTTNLPGYHFPDGFSARLLIRGGVVTNVYGGNDIRGKVFGGNAVGIYTSILGDVYGGGNGSYPYTDNDRLKDDQTYGDFYYSQSEVPGATSSVDALNAIRPNAEQVSLRIWGSSEADPTVIRGSIYLGGNSATLAPSGVGTPTVELKIGSHVIADKVFLGNNGANMVSTNERNVEEHQYEGVLRTMQRTDLTGDGTRFSSIALTDATDFAKYMEGAAMDLMPSVVFDDAENKGDPDTYEEHSSYFGSFYCGGNVGSMTKTGCESINFNHQVVIFDKLVGGCNNAIVPENGTFNARYEGGLIGTPDATTGNRLELSLSGLLVEPMRWKAAKDGSTYPFNYLEWNTWLNGSETTAVTTLTPDAGKDYKTSDADDHARRLMGGNIYGGCYTSGIVNGNVVININGTIIERDKLFDEVESDELGEEISLYGDSQTNDTQYRITERRTGVILGEQGMDVLGSSLNVFGGGKGKDTEIWGSTTINLSRGYTFQIFGGSEEGVIGKPDASGDYAFNGKQFKYDPKYTCTVNVNGQNPGVSKKADSSENMSEAEFIYGGGFFGPICGNTVINLGKGRVFNTFAGSCMADILGHTETYVGRQVDATTGAVSEGFPWIRDIVYGGNDLGGEVKGEADFTSRVRSTEGGDDFNAIGMVHNTAMLTASAYVEYTQGRADAIFGGHYGTYNYKDTEYGAYFNADGTAKDNYTKPRMGNAFVNFRPTLNEKLKANEHNSVSRIYGGSQGYPGDQDRDIMQRSSYVLIDIPQDMDENSTYPHYKYMEVFGGGAWCGMGMQQEDGVITPELFADMDNDAKDRYSASIDLARGHIGAAYGGSLNEGVVRRSWVNVPVGSTIEAGSLFAGGYGSGIFDPCDVYEGHVEYHSADALLVNDRKRKDKSNNDIGHDMMLGAIYGGNNAARRTLYGFINIDVPVRQSHYQYGMTTATVYGAGYGSNTWSEYTEVNLNDGAEVYEVYGGGEAGGVMSPESVTTYYATNPAGLAADKWAAAWTVGGDYDPESFANYHTHTWTSANNPLVRTAEVDNRSSKTYKYNTNVLIHKGAYVRNYAYGGGYGKEDDVFVGSGDVYGTTYIALLGGRVAKDIYAAGTMGRVYNIFNSPDFTASANAYIAGGTCRNVYGGGWQGDVGHHTGKPAVKDEHGNVTTPADPNDIDDDILGETHVVIGIRPDQTDADKLAEIQKVTGTGGTLSDYGFLCGVPAIQRNAYAGGEGGAVFGTANLVLNNGYIGYVHLNAGEEQDERGNVVEAGTATEERYDEKINDETYFVEGVWQGETRLRDCGNVFGGGYDVRSSVDISNVTVWNGTVRNSMHGGGEIATIGRGATQESGEANSERVLKAIYKPGATHVTMYNGHVKRNIFGGGKGYNIWGYGQQGTLYTDGYVFGSTEVNVHGGEVGTEAGVADGYGNVFGGGDIGFVYSGSIKSGTEDTGSHTEGTGSPNHYYYKDAGGHLTEDCKVVISPYLQVMDNATTVNGTTYAPYSYVPTEDLNTLPKKDDSGHWTGAWLDFFTETNTGIQRGVTIRNAVFGGGNVSSNSDTHYANATTIFGNATATLYDVYHRDFITIGTEHTGGIYGGGNLTLVDGYRELNITNYGTDYYGLEEQITLEEYHSLSNRERAYFQLQYICKADITIGGEFYRGDEKISEENYLKLLEKYGTTVENAFTPYGFCSIYAGRLLNTIQRADFCGVYGSRMVLQGAKDRVADVGEDIPYTINRVGELSLNQQSSTAGDTGDDATHGNYFGIYSLVNYMGNLTSDVKFGDNRRYQDNDKKNVEDTQQSYYAFKKSKYGSGAPKSDRNKGVSANQVALASGVFLELTTENSTETHKDYGYITGIVELDLINVKKELVGGGFVYAKNEHRVPKYYPNKENVLLSVYNRTMSNEARTHRRYYYANEDLPTGDEATGAEVFSGETAFLEKEWETSGNFIHPTKTIVDDCYPTNNAYKLADANHSEAHYWYVKGSIYIYDQEVSAYTGAANAYSKAVHLPLTITAASHGRLQLLNVKPNLYAYYVADPENETQKVKIGSVKDADGKLVDKVWVNNENESYGLNDVITWWDWHQMSYKDRQYFVTMTYVNAENCTIDGNDYAAGSYVLSEDDLATFKTASHTILNAEGDTVSDVDKLFRPSNNIGHKTGYALTFDMDTPKVWDNYYTKEDDNTDKKTQKEYDELLSSAQESYVEGPTYYPTTPGTYGQREIVEGDILTQVQVDANETTGTGAAEVELAYIAKTAVTYTYNTTSKTANVGTAIPKSEYDAIDADAQEAFDPAFVCTQTLKLSDNTYLTYGDVKGTTEITALKTSFSSFGSQIDDALSPAYICSTAGNFGGKAYQADTNYSALQTLCSLSASDFTAGGFTFNYDAFDLLSDDDMLEVDESATDIVVDLASIKPTLPNTEDSYHSPYSDQVGVEYQAVFKATGDKTSYSYPAGTTEAGKAYPARTLSDGDNIPNDVFEAAVPNEKAHYTRVSVKDGGEDICIATDNFVYNGVPYGKGQVVDEELLTTGKVETVRFNNGGTWFYCFENYDGGSQKGRIISESAYTDLLNDQQYFVIQGKEPTETTTLYVSSQSDAKDVLKERVYTVVYQYTYYEEEDDGNIKLNNELHVVNIHLMLESGAPSVGLVSPPGTVLPGDAVGLKAPEVKPGLYEVITSGWELFANENDALHHRNGTPFVNNVTPVYWYQNQKQYLAFYSKTYLGKTYSKNYVPLSVANYHDLDEVMKDTEHHLYVDHPDVLRDSKVYIDDRTCESDENKSELDLLKDFFDLSLLDGSAVNTDGDGLITTIKPEGTVDSPFKGHALLDSHVRAGRNLEFILRSDVSPKAYSSGWTPIGNDNTTGDTGQCFDGILHGDGHTISGLDHSLFGHLCGEVYNLGVTGSFTTAGIADEGDGYVENCWVATTGTEPETVKPKAVFGNPTDDSSTQVVNSYYPESNSSLYDLGGLATQMPDKAFYNGTVAYNLNGFYLKKRFYDATTPGGSPSGYIDYRYLPSAADGTLPAEMVTAKYPDDAYHHYQPVGTTETPNLGYVEHRFYDGDFVYAGGNIPESNNIRMRSVSGTDGSGKPIVTNYFTPIWPDDYLFFGQTLTYGHVAARPHQDTPSAINRSSERLSTADASNRVYRAPAYFRNSRMDVAHFNPAAVFAQAKAGDAAVTAYKGMTAIDFTGYQDNIAANYKSGFITAAPYSHISGGAFFPPLLDDDGLSSFQNVDLTQNLLVYTSTATDAAALTDNAVSTYLHDEAYTETDDKYHTVAAWDPYSSTIRGHWVRQTGSDMYMALRDHMLVDKQDFNAPIAYSFDDDYRMWYQRKPANYVDIEWSSDATPVRTTKGWEGISLPFKAEIVTTQQKGELTHFYNTTAGGTGAGNLGSVGHEYWLRQFTGIDDGKSTLSVLSATLTYPAANSVDGQKDCSNTFLWDYYYSYNDYDDLNGDDYQENDQSRNYYKTGREYPDYPRLAAAKPYIIGFPGKRYYEFDLSGEFKPETAQPTIASKLDAQTITFASATGVEIGVSDDEMTGDKATHGGKDYTFKPNYLNKSFAAGTDNTYTLNSLGDSYEVIPSSGEPVAVSAFRPYFIAAASSGARPGTIVFANGFDDTIKPHGLDDDDDVSGALDIRTGSHKVVVTSSLKYEADVRIMSVSGSTLAAFTVKSGETVETPIPVTGVYIIHANSGRFLKKVVVK